MYLALGTVFKRFSRKHRADLDGHELTMEPGGAVPGYLFASGSSSVSISSPSSRRDSTFSTVKTIFIVCAAEIMISIGETDGPNPLLPDSERESA